MNEHFRAFSFVDRITSLNAGVSVEGSYAIPADVDSFPDLLVAEAVGQLAAWSAMAAVDFKYRPVAGLAEKVELFSSVRPGQTLKLAADLQSADSEAVAYGGTAHADGVPVIRLENCVGPMMPLEEFDDPAAVRQRFELLRGEGAAPGAFRGLPNVALEPAGHETGHWRKGVVEVPASAPFFGDHFPRRPVFPGTLLMSLNFLLARSLTAELPTPVKNGVWKLKSVTNTKFRSFTPPRARLECEARLDRQSDGEALVIVESRDGKRVVASGQALYVAEERP